MKYKLKKEARQFFDEKHHTNIYPIEVWKKEGIHINLLDEVDRVYIDYGIKFSESGTGLKGHSGEKKEAHYEFTIRVLDMDYKEYENVKVAPLMDELQKVCDRYFKNGY